LFCTALRLLFGQYVEVLDSIPYPSAFPLIVFTGANAPTTIDRFPRGEAVHYRERALAEGVPDNVIRVEPKARNTGENMTLTRELLAAEGVTPREVMLISRPYQERRAYATCRKLWPEVDIVCTSQRIDLDAYAAGIGDIPRMINVMVGDTQRIRLHAEHGYAIHQDIPTTCRPRTSDSSVPDTPRISSPRPPESVAR
jgi:hypothetical protein